MKNAITKSGRKSSLSWGTSTTRQMDTPRNRCQAIPAHVNGCSNMDTIYRKSAQQVENCEIRTFGGSQSSKMRTKFTMLYAAEMGQQYYNESFKSFYGVNNYISDALLHDNYLLWAMASFNVICNVHIDYVK